MYARFLRVWVHFDVLSDGSFPRHRFWKKTLPSLVYSHGSENCNNPANITILGNSPQGMGCLVYFWAENRYSFINSIRYFSKFLCPKRFFTQKAGIRLRTLSFMLKRLTITVKFGTFKKTKFFNSFQIFFANFSDLFHAKNANRPNGECSMNSVIICKQLFIDIPKQITDRYFSILYVAVFVCLVPNE